MALIHLRQASLAFGAAPLLDKAEMTIDSGEKIALVGRNGAGKSSLMGVISGAIKLDEGELVIQQGVKVATLPQDLPIGYTGTIYEQVADGLAEMGKDLAEYHRIAANATTEADLSRLADIQSRIDAVNGWQLDTRVQTMLSQLNLDGDLPFDSLSGGMKRRVLLAQALVAQPDVLLLDEPTNHLDIEAISQLEQTIQGLRIAVLLVTHDRAFLRRVANRIVELDRGSITSWQTGYDGYLRGRAQQEESEQRANALEDKKLAQEETWIRQGIKARRTRNEGRVRALKVLRQERSERRNKQGVAKIKVDAGESSGKKVVEVQGLDYSLESGQKIVRNLDLTVLRGDKIGLIGPNGCGKSTLIKLLLGLWKPQAGSIELGTQLNIAYFDQSREQLDPNQTVQDNVGGGSDTVTVNGRSRHILSYLQDFLFAPATARAPISRLSGGEKNRLLLAKLFAKPSNLLILDEPTNDLDIETLELLESILVEYPGTVLIVSHDRDFLDNVVTSSLVFEGNGRIQEFIGGYSDWKVYADKRAEVEAKSKRVEKKVEPKLTAVAEKKKNNKLSYKDQRELDSLPAKIELLEEQMESLQQKMGEPSFYQQSQSEIAASNKQLETLTSELEAAMDRWEALEAMKTN